MSGRNLNKEIFLNTVKGDIANGTENSLAMLKRTWPGLPDSCCKMVTELVASAMNRPEKDRVSLVVTAPPSFTVNARMTMSVVQSMLENARRSILLTGYAVSSYFAKLTDEIILKSQQGVAVKFFVNDFDNQPELGKMRHYAGPFLKIYNYHQEKDDLSALHAKIISVDQKMTLITSANLSYHGQQGNIEFGTLIESRHLASQIEDIFEKLVSSRIFNIIRRSDEPE